MQMYFLGYLKLIMMSNNFGFISDNDDKITIHLFVCKF